MYALLVAAGRVPNVPSASFELRTLPSLAAAKYVPGLPCLSRRRDEIFNRGRVERKHIVMAGNHRSRRDLAAQPCRFLCVQVSRNPPFRAAAIDGEQGGVDPEWLQALRQRGMQHRVATVVDGPLPELDHIAQKPASPGPIRRTTAAYGSAGRSSQQRRDGLGPISDPS